MKVAVLTSSLAPYRVSGAERQAAEAAVQLARRGHRVTVFSRRMLRDQPHVTEHDGVRWIRCSTIQAPGLSFPSHILSFRRAWAREHGAAPFDCLLAYSMVINGVLGALAYRRDKVPMVMWVRSEGEILLRKRFKYRRLSPWVLRHSRHVLTQAESIRKAMLFELQAMGKDAVATHMSKNASVLPNAVYVPEDVNWQNREGLVFVGRLVDIKGVDRLIQVVRDLDPHPAAHIIGDGPLRSRLEEQARGLPVTFHGYCQPEEIRARLDNARLLVAPSTIEGFPNVVLEGMAHGIPAVASDVGGVSSLLVDGKNGYLVRPGDQPQLLARVREILGDEALWRRMAEAARATAVEYGWDAHISKLEEILSAATEDPRP